MLPFGPWLDRLEYRSQPLEPSLHLLDALNAYVTAQPLPLPGSLDREVHLRDQADRAPRRTTVAKVLEQEVKHADCHLTAIDSELRRESHAGRRSRCVLGAGSWASAGERSRIGALRARGPSAQDPGTQQVWKPTGTRCGS